MRAYRVHFDRLHSNRYIPGYMDVWADNKKEAVSIVKNHVYYFCNFSWRFYPFHAEAERIDPNMMVRRVVFK